MYATTPTTQTFVFRPRNVFHVSPPRTAPRKDAAAPTALRPIGPDIDAWARHANAANGFGEAATGLEPRPGTKSRHGS